MKSMSLALVATLLLSSPLAGVSAEFVPTAPMHTSRTADTATLLHNGKVLVAGGSVVQYFDYTPSAELYDPGTGSWQDTGSLNIGRLNHTATLLRDGKVLVAGGDSSTPDLNSAELYNPGTQAWSFTGSLNQGRELHSATLLPNGKVLVAGGYNYGNLTSAELYDPRHESWTTTGSLNIPRFGHTATLLLNGKVLVAGGGWFYGYNVAALNSAELYDPVTGEWTQTGSMTNPRWQHTAALLPNGEVLVAGGRDLSSTNLVGYSAELYNPATGQWTPTGSMTDARYLHTATLLKNGQVLVAGGFDETSDAPLASAELYDPISKTWTTTATMNEPHGWPSATLLKNDQVLIAGGFGTNGIILRSAELYESTSSNTRH